MGNWATDQCLRYPLCWWSKGGRCPAAASTYGAELWITRRRGVSAEAVAGPAEDRRGWTGGNRPTGIGSRTRPTMAGMQRSRLAFVTGGRCEKVMAGLSIVKVTGTKTAELPLPGCLPAEPMIGGGVPAAPRTPQRGSTSRARTSMCRRGDELLVTCTFKDPCKSRAVARPTVGGAVLSWANGGYQRRRRR